MLSLLSTTYKCKDLNFKSTDLKNNLKWPSVNWPRLGWKSYNTAIWHIRENLPKEFRSENASKSYHGRCYYENFETSQADNTHKNKPYLSSGIQKESKKASAEWTAKHNQYLSMDRPKLCELKKRVIAAGTVDYRKKLLSLFSKDTKSVT